MSSQETGRQIGRWLSNAPEGYPEASLDDLVAVATDRFEPTNDAYGPVRGWGECTPGELRLKAAEILESATNDEDYADALNFLIMARDVQIERELEAFSDG